jgi:H+/Cl- antiporter ClcA
VTDDAVSPAAPAEPPAPLVPAGLDPLALIKTKSYVVLLVLGAIVGLPVAFVSYFFLKLVSVVSEFAFTTLPNDLGFADVPIWWPVVPLTVAGVLVGLVLNYLPGTGGHIPAKGFVAAGTTPPIELFGIAGAAFFTLSLGVVLGPEAPLIAIGSGLAVLAVHLIKKDAPEMAITVVGAAGSFAAISALLGSPIVGAFLLMEVAGIGGGLLGVVLLPGLLAAGIGSLIFVGLGSWTGYGTFSLTVPDIPPFTTPDFAEFAWAIVIGLLAAVVGTTIRRLGLFVFPFADRRKLIVIPAAGLAIGLLAVLFAQVTGRSSSEVLFSGQDALPGLLEGAAGWTVGALLMLLLCKGIAYGIALGSFRGGPTFPGMFLGAVGGIALSHLAGLPMIAGAAMGIGAMTVVMLNGMPLTSVLLTSVFLQTDSLSLMPLVIVAVVVAYVASAWLAPALDPPAAASPSDAAPDSPDAAPAPG